ncbi:PREDICTED: F-box/kelch-repeat protein At4g33290-like [Camelina sativa]|uniref:F-box/kelch-repeat protein At4g33290-like n=1 Tax=Camelina sativa TaxID=90675 RepID=A0ABM0V6S6_CAMSA|nr:PREDICTED: F-box/kelch-repeat protein At4g33290-like [Camelina sativa]
MAMTISDLPEDLQREIVCRVTQKDMRAVRLTCKTWDTLWKSERFRKMHMCNEEAAREEGESRVIALIDWNLHLISVVVDDVDHPSTEIKGKLSCLDDQQQRQQENIMKVCHCDGLLLCALKDSFRLLVLNPFLRQTRWIEPPSFSFPCLSDRYVYDCYRYALGYDYNKNSHKILRFMEVKMWLRTGHLFCYEIYEIYGFDSNSWKTLDVGTPHWSITNHKDCVPLKGNTYWLATLHRNSYCQYDGLVCFDFTNERFGPVLPLPPDEDDLLVKYAVLSRLRGDKLALLLKFHQPTVDEIWVTTVIDPSQVSWSKFLILDRRPGVPELFWELFPIGFFIDEEKKVAMVLDSKGKLSIFGEDGFFRQVDLPVHPLHPSTNNYHQVCFLYTPSLVQIHKSL